MIYCIVFWITAVYICITALSMQILKPAGFQDSGHYPLLLLVYVWAHVFTHLSTVHLVHTQKKVCVRKQRWPYMAVLINGDFLDRVLTRHINLQTHCFIIHLSLIIITQWMRKLTLLSTLFFHQHGLSFTLQLNSEIFRMWPFVLCLPLSFHSV